MSGAGVGIRIFEQRLPGFLKIGAVRAKWRRQRKILDSIRRQGIEVAVCFTLAHHGLRMSMIIDRVNLPQFSFDPALDI